MKNIPYGFQSPLLAQKKLLEFVSLAKRNNKNCDTVVANPCHDEMTNIYTVPLFHRGISSLHPRNDDISTEELRALWLRAYRRAYERNLNSERGQEAIVKASHTHGDLITSIICPDSQKLQKEHKGLYQQQYLTEKEASRTFLIK